MLEMLEAMLEVLRGIEVEFVALMVVLLKLPKPIVPLVPLLIFSGGS